MASTYFLDHVPPSARQEHTKLELPEDVLIRVANYLDVYGLAKLRRTGRKGRRCADLSVLQMRIDESRSDRMDRTMYMNRDERVRHFIAQVRLSAIACVHRATSFFVEGCKNSYEDLIDMQEWADFLGLCLCACGASANKDCTEKVNTLIALGATVSPQIEVEWWEAITSESSTSQWFWSLLGPSYGEAPLEAAERYGNMQVATILLELGAVPQARAKDQPRLPRWVRLHYYPKWVRAIKWTIGPVGVLLGIKCVGREKLVKRLRPSFQCE